MSVKELRNIFNKKSSKAPLCKKLILFASHDDIIESQIKLATPDIKQIELDNERLKNKQMQERGSSFEGDGKGEQRVSNLVDRFQSIINQNQQRTKEEQEIWDKLSQNKQSNSDKRTLQEQFEEALRNR